MPGGLAVRTSLSKMSCLSWSDSFYSCWSVLQRWLYFKPFKKEISEPMPNPEQAE
jgi:hypothetical protein